MFGELIPVGGGDPIPLLKRHLLVGRRESCDIVLRFSNVSAHHCELTVDNGYWYVKDLGSSNGVKVNDLRVLERRVDPGAKLSIAKHSYELQYSPEDLGAVGPPPPETMQHDLFSKSLLERAGLERRHKDGDAPHHHSHRPSRGSRYDVLDDRAGQIKDPNRPT
jgi:adenylate cyclase